jgi:C-terminal processing protease CtpA/Prc
VGWQFFQGAIAGTTPEEAIFGMVWDTLYGGGDPSGHVNSHISQAIDDWKASARGVILDHRAGSGGTLDAVDNLSRLVRPPETIAIDWSPMMIAGFDGPETAVEGVALFEQHKATFPWTVGATDYDPQLPVALITHRDVSASDYLPYALKGSPKLRVFGPHGTAGAFSTFVNYRYWGGLSYQFANGEPIASDGAALIGHGVVPDELVDQRQSDLLAGVDTIHEAALAWVRQELKP